MRRPVIYGSDLTAPVAYRWKTQVNENAKMPAFSATLPEADHNEIEGWSGADGGFAAIFLQDRDQHPRERKRFELTAKAIAPYAAAVIEVETEGETRTERVLHAVMLGDLVAIELANGARGRSAGGRRARGFQEGDGPAGRDLVQPLLEPDDHRVSRLPCRSPSARRP